jgi:ATP-dependent DNA helicase RecG
MSMHDFAPGTFIQKVDTCSTKVDTSSRKVDTSSGKVDSSTAKVDTYAQSAKQLTKSVDYLKNKVFPELMRNGKLEKRFPFTHNHPEQGYKSVSEHG